MSAIVAFNSVLVQFIKELSETFPDDAKLGAYYAIVEATCTGDSTVGVDTFRKTLGKFPAEIGRHDESMFDACDPLFGQVDVGAIWKTQGLSEENKNVFWDYLQALMSLCDAVHPRPEGPHAEYCVTADSSTTMMAAQALTALRNGGGGDIGSVVGSMVPPELSTVMGEMIKGVDMNDVVALAQGIDQKDIEDVLGAIDPAVLASIGSGEGLSMDTMMNVAKNIDPQNLMKIAEKFDKNTLARVASQVDQEGLMNVLGTFGKKRHSK